MVQVLAWALLSWLLALHSYLQSAHKLSQCAHLPHQFISLRYIYPLLFTHSLSDCCIHSGVHLDQYSLACLPACSPTHYYLLTSVSLRPFPSFISALQSSAWDCFIPMPSTSIPPTFLTIKPASSIPQLVRVCVWVYLATYNSGPHIKQVVQGSEGSRFNRRPC